MNHFLRILAILILASCQKDTPSVPVTDSTHIEYFGFVLIDTGWDDSTDNEPKTNYIDEVHAFSNIADILVVNPSDNIVSRIQQMDAVEVKSVLHLSEIFFEWISTSGPSGADYALRTDYQSRWDTFVNTNNLSVNQDLIQAFYIGEEPTWNGISFAELKSAADYIKATLPDVPILIIEASAAINQLQIPNSVDWIGFDHYFVKDPNTNTVFRDELNNLKSKFSSEDQKLVLVMDAHFISAYHHDYAGISLAEMKGVANNYYALAKSEPKTIAIIGYFWPGGFDDPTAIGARNMPEDVKSNYIRIGKEITGKQ